MKTILTTLLLAATLPAQAQFVDGNTLLQRMGGDDAARVAAYGYVGGVADAAVVGTDWCPKANISLSQIFDLTRNILATVPEHRHQAADIYVRVALARIAPCPKRQKGEGV